MAQRQFRTDDTSVWADRYGDGKDGALTVSGSSTHSCANQSCSGTSGSTTLTLDSAGTFANGDLVMIHQTRGTTGGGAGMWELNKISSGAGTTTLTMGYSLINTYTDSGADQAQIIELKEYTNVTVNTAVTYSAPAWDGNIGGILAFLATGTVTVTGNLSATSMGYRGGAANPLPAPVFQGEGTSAGSSQSTSANGVGGGGGETRGGGGAGGHAGSGSAGANGNAGGTGGSAGGTGGSASLTTMVFGGAGGGGGSWSAGTTEVRGGAGGDGGGIIFIIGKTITVTGTIVTSGDNGANAVGSDGGGGGAGAGGSILIKGQTVTLGSGIITALGSTVGGTPDGTGTGGQPASNGRIHCDYSQTLSGTTSPTLDSSQDLVLNDLPSIENYTLLM